MTQLWRHQPIKNIKEVNAVGHLFVLHATAHMLYAIAHLFVCPSVRPSVPRVDQSKMVEIRIMQLSPQSSPMTQVSSWLTSAQNFKGNIDSGSTNETRVGKICNFRPIRCRISETAQDRTKVTTNRKSHLCFRLVPSLTLDDLELL